ncbi:putative apyrase [Rosa chinensis]|uniref:Putative apyrase n=1 Tax=Rosa chinensis TaxID=74649 RepID=A0A2P6PZK9_ROSCH|nr:probable apyrase 7 [Rosa chinensis]XP_024162917.1 probable apyrase 7 [Rosa chinensis]XP_040364113.1 probable apyrase 7 [Rosa chinensis]PRQ27353.1 putative apyrase [Rosa chinensis]
MVFNRIANFFASLSSRWSSPQGGSAVSPPKSAAFAFANTARNKNLLRLSSSLQDFSSYSQLDIEDPNIATVTHSKPPPHSLQRETAAASSFSKEKSLPGGGGGGAPFSRNKWVRAFMFLCCVLLVGFLVYLVSMLVYSYWSKGEPKFYIVLDCGSTGTRVYVYQATLDNEKDNSFPIVMKSLTEGLQRKPKAHTGRAYDRMETEPGLDKLVHNVSGLKVAIKPLVQWAEKQIPKNAHKTTSLFLYATAGVRRLPSNDSKWLLDNAWSILKSSPFLCQRDWVRTISGLEEAYFGWIALNHHRGMFGAGPRKPTFGSLDLGGSSLQVTFESNEHVQKDTGLNIRIGAVNHHLTAYSLPGYGLNDAFDKSVGRLFERLPEVNKTELVNGKGELKHPCLQSGYKEQYICSQCVSKFQEGGSPVIAKKSLGKGGRSGVSLTLIGAPNWEECGKLARVAVNLSEWSNITPALDCDVQPCALPDGLPRPYGNFYAISGFFVVYRFFNLTSESSLDDVLEKGRQFCERTWEAAKKSVAPQPFIEQYCFRAPYIAFLLREGLHIIDNQITIGSGSITWTQGVALLEAGKTLSTGLGFRSYEVLRMKINPLFLLSVLFISLILLLCALSCIANWMPKIFWRPYLPLFWTNNASSASGIPSPFRFQRWSPIIPGDGRVKTPLSPTIAGGVQQRPFGLGHGLNNSGGIQLMESSLYPSSSSISHSYSSNSLGQMQFDSSSMGSFWSPHRSQMRLQSRRSQSREDLNSSLTEAHMAKV